jgi:tetratricopeptide (TPR) repeat protein
VLPIHRVEDFAETVPSAWLERGGFFISLYQREALFLQFDGEQTHPAITKVCVGRINAITGKPYENRLSPHEQDYIVIPDQKWLDGINSGKDIVKQFVAMPLGQGYTVEGQITDEETYGGFQLEIFEPKDGYFDDPDYSVDKKIDLVVRISKSEFEAMLLQTNTFSRTIMNTIRAGATAEGAAEITGLDKEEVCRIYFDFRAKFFDFVENLVRVKFAEDPWFTSIKSKSLRNLSSLGLRDDIDPLPKDEKLDSETKKTELAPEIQPRKIAILGSSEECSGALYSSPSRPIDTEMGIAAGGRLTQKIMKDRYGFDAWDSQRSRFVDIHIVNSEMYQAITGLEPLSSPVSPEQYQKSGIPWFSHYEESAQSVKAAGALKKIQSVAEIDKKRGLHGQHQEAQQTINPEVIRRIRTPDVKEAATDFRRRAFENAAAARWKEAIREINYLIDLGLKVSASDYALRSHCNYQLDQFFESDIDSDLALEIDPRSVDALVLKARCSLTLGDHEGAKTAAEALVSFRPPNPIGFEVLAESALIRRDFKEAQQNVSLAFTFGLESDRADEIAKLASEALANE